MKSFIILLLLTAALGARLGFDSRIVGGSQATEGQFKYTVSVKRWNWHYCGGSIISTTRILSAAHCYDKQPASEYSVHAGIIDNVQAGQSHKVDYFSVHEDYDPKFIINDFAVLHLSSSIVYNDVIQPIRLSGIHVGDGVACVVSGWGRESTWGNYPNMLKYLNSVTVSNEYCAERLSNVWQPIRETSLCTFTVTGEGTCNADSGSPLVSDDGQIGVVSWGIPCANGYPDVFGRVSEYKDWIASH